MPFGHVRRPMVVDPDEPLEWIRHFRSGVYGSLCGVAN
jgi:hypothetical protein